MQCDSRTYRFGSVGEDNKLLLVSRMGIQMAPLTHSFLSVGFFQWGFTPAKTKHTPILALAFVNYIPGFKTTERDICIESTHGTRLS